MGDVAICAIFTSLPKTDVGKSSVGHSSSCLAGVLEMDDRPGTDEKFRKCSVMGQLVDDDDEVNVKIVQVSCVWVCVVAFCCVVFFSSLSGVPKHFFYFFLFLEYSRSPAVKKFLLSYAPRDICIPPVPLNLDYSVMAKQANTSLQLVDWDMLIVPNSCVVMSLSKAKPMPLLQLVAQ